MFNDKLALGEELLDESFVAYSLVFFGFFFLYGLPSMVKSCGVV